MDVNTIFKDLATMVHEQGETIDSIEGNVEQASITVHDGTEQLRQAERYKVRYQKILNLYPAHYIYFFLFLFLFYFIILKFFQNKARKKKVCLAITGIVILAVIIGIIVWQVKK